MLNSFIVFIEPENIDARVIVIARSKLITIQNGDAVVCDCAFEMDRFARIPNQLRNLWGHAALIDNGTFKY